MNILNRIQEETKTEDDIKNDEEMLTYKDTQEEELPREEMEARDGKVRK